MIYKGKGGIQYDLKSSPFAQGGEGKIFDIIGKPNIVAKLYKDGKNDATKERKLLAMINNPPSKTIMSQIAWPQDVLYDGSNTFVGFVMPKLAINEDLNVIYEYGTSSKYPNVPWGNKIIIAKNLCAVLDAVHEAGHVVGDLNPKNISVDPKTGHIIFVDTDSYHVEDNGNVYRCNVGMPEYLPVEIQKKMKGGLTAAPLPTFTKETDNFALAIHIFQLLMNGTHPFSCRVLPSQASVVFPQPSDNILNGDFPFVNPRLGTSIPVFAPPLNILPKEMQELFKRAFVAGHTNPKQRPTPEEWYIALTNLEGQLKQCGKVSHHEYYSGLSQCPWCTTDQNFTQGVATTTAAVKKITMVQSTISKGMTPAYVPAPKPQQNQVSNTNSVSNSGATSAAPSYNTSYRSNSVLGKIKIIAIVLVVLAVVGLGAYFITKKVKANSTKTIYITSASDFEMFDKYPKATYELTQDIDLGGADISDTGETYFAGHFNGNGYKLYNFNLNSAMFYVLTDDAVVENVILCDFTAKGRAILANENNGTINRVAICNGVLSCDIPESYAGGMVAGNYGTITESYVDDVKINCAFSTSSGEIGGIAGRQGGIIENCFTNVEITVGSYSGGDLNAGGLTGYNYGGSLTNSYSRCEIYHNSALSTAYLGGISGVNKDDDSYIRNCFCYSTTVDTTGYRNRKTGLFSSSTNTIINCFFVDLANSSETIYSTSWYTSSLKWDIGIWNISNSWPTLWWSN